MKTLQRYCRFATALLLTIGSAALCAAEWIPPAAADLRGSTSPKSVEGDFDGDGKLDTAALKINRTTGEMNLFITLSSRPDATLSPLPSTPLSMVASIGLGVLPAGEYLTLCGKSYYQCADDEPARVTTRYSVIEYYVEESASSFLVFSEDTGTFEQFWSSD